MIKKIIIGLIIFAGIYYAYIVYNQFFSENNIVKNNIIEEYKEDNNLINDKEKEILDFKYKSVGEVGGGDTF